MANRHLSRSIVMQSLFEWDFNGKPTKGFLDILKRNNEEFSSGVSDMSFMQSLMEIVVKKSNDLDNIIEKAAPDWPISKIAIIDRNILRMGLSELLFSDKKEVPAKVAINEAIELAKTFGGENSGKFVNGVLGAVYKELGEPGKDEASDKKRSARYIPYDEIPLENLVGAVVYAKEGDDIFLGFVHDIFGHWTLSKGHILEKESNEDAIVRKVKEEMGIDVVCKDKLGENEYVAGSKDNPDKVRKHVAYYLAEGKYQDLKLGPSGGLDDARWFKLSEILDLNFYDDILEIVTIALKILAGEKTK